MLTIVLCKFNIWYRFTVCKKDELCLTIVISFEFISWWIHQPYQIKYNVKIRKHINYISLKKCPILISWLNFFPTQVISLHKVRNIFLLKRITNEKSNPFWISNDKIKPTFTILLLSNQHFITISYYEG